MYFKGSDSNREMFSSQGVEVYFACLLFLFYSSSPSTTRMGSK